MGDAVSRWRPLITADTAAVAALLAKSDRDWGNVVERTRAEAGDLCRHDAGSAHVSGDGIDAVAVRVGVTEVVLRASSDAPARPRLLGEGLELLRAALAAGAALWLPTRDDEAADLARRHGLHEDYTDLQMRVDLTEASAPSRPAPPSYRWRAVDDVSAVADEVHDLVCAAWGVAPHRKEFRARFEGAGADATSWVLLDRSTAPGRLAAAAIGQVQTLADGTFGVVTHLDVHPDERRRGLGTATLHELLHRFRRRGLQTAQLGVHADNASGAPQLYRSLGWREVSAQTRWGAGSLVET